MPKKHKIVIILIVPTLLIAGFAFIASAGSNCTPHCESSFCFSCSCAAEAKITRISCDNLLKTWDAVINEAKLFLEELLSAILLPHHFILPTDIVTSEILAITKHFQPNPLYSIIFSRAPPYFPFNFQR